MAKMTRAEKRRRRTAKVVEMKLDGIKEADTFRELSYEDLTRYHRAWKRQRDESSLWGTSLTDMILNQKAREIQRGIDQQLMGWVNGQVGMGKHKSDEVEAYESEGE